MAVNKGRHFTTDGARKAANGAFHPHDGPSSAVALDGESWLDGPMSATQQAAEWGNLFQRALLQGAITWNECLARGLTEFGKAKNPLQMAYAEAAGANRLLEAFAAQQSGLLQLVADSQLHLLSNMFRDVAAPQVTALPAENGRDLLSAWGRAQDEWLKITKGVIEATNAVQAAPPTGL